MDTSNQGSNHVLWALCSQKTLLIQMKGIGEREAAKSIAEAKALRGHRKRLGAFRGDKNIHIALLSKREWESVDSYWVYCWVMEGVLRNSLTEKTRSQFSRKFLFFWSRSKVTSMLFQMEMFFFSTSWCRITIFTQAFFLLSVKSAPHSPHRGHGSVLEKCLGFSFRVRWKTLLLLEQFKYLIHKVFEKERVRSTNRLGLQQRQQR